MPQMNIVSVSKILEGALEGDILKVRSYADTLQKNLEASGEDRAARIIKSVLDGSYKDKPKVTTQLDNNKGNCNGDYGASTLCGNCNDDKCPYYLPWA